MASMLVEELDSDIVAARDKLRNINEKVTSLSGRAPRQRISYNDEPEDAPLREVDRGSFGLREEATPWSTRKELPILPSQQQVAGGIRRRISIEDRIDRRSGGGRQSFDHLPKRQRPDYLDDEVEEDDYGKRPKRSIQSTVVMPALDSKGRDEKIEKLKSAENKDSKQRTRRLFSNLIVGTLTSFSKTEKKTTQQEKQEEVEKRLEESKQKEFNARREEKHELLNKRREQEKELQGLQRKKALIQYAEHKVKQLGFMKGSIQTTAEPKIFWQPTKHTARSMELKQTTEKHLDSLIKEREVQLANDLEARGRNEERGTHKEEDGGNEEEDDDYEEEDKNENEEIEVVLKTEEDLKREAEEEETKDEEDIDVHVELD